jgi:phosphotransferase system HPr (HPr) family protein
VGFREFTLAKSSLNVMSLGAKKGEKVLIRAVGEDAEELISANEH